MTQLVSFTVRATGNLSGRFVMAVRRDRPHPSYLRPGDRVYWKEYGVGEVYAVGPSVYIEWSRAGWLHHDRAFVHQLQWATPED